MSHEHKQEKDTASDDQLVVDAVHRDGDASTGLVNADPDELYARIETLAKHGKGSLKDLPRLVASLPTEMKKKVADLMPDLAKRISGDDVIAISELVYERLDFRIENALSAKPPVSAERLKRYLRTMSSDDIAWLGDNQPTLEKVQKLLPGPFGLELPQVADLPTPLHKKPALVSWYIAKTDPTLVALHFSARATPELAVTLDALGEWKWLKALHVGRGYTFGSGLEVLRDASSQRPIKDQITTILGTFSSASYSPADTAKGKQDLQHELSSRGSSDELLDAGARGLDLDGVDMTAVQSRLRGEPASVVLELAIATSMPLAAAIESLAAAPGVTAEQMHALLMEKQGDQRAAVLVDAKLRAQVRKVVGKSLPLARFFAEPAERDRAHALIYRDEATREWAYSDRDPETKLWLSAGSSHAHEACKLVRRDVGFAWVRELTGSADKTQLRRLALNCGDAGTTKHVRDHLLGDREIQIDADENQVQATSDEVYGHAGARGDVARLNEALAGDDINDDRVLDRLADMNATDRAALVADQREMQNIFSKLDTAATTRAVFLLGPTLAQLLKLPLRDQVQLLDYVSTRPASEQEFVLMKAALIDPARTIFPRVSPLMLYPTLYDPTVMTHALKASPDLLAWMLEDTDPSLALSCLARDGVRGVAAPIFETRSHIADQLPQYKHLLPAGKQAFDTIAKTVTNEDTKEEAKEYKEGSVEAEAPVEARATRVQTASAHSHLWDALERLFKDHGRTQEAYALINNATAKERIALLDGSHTQTVQALRSAVAVSPRHLFPSLTTAQLLSLPDAAAWLLEDEPAYALLGRATLSTNGTKQLGLVLDENPSRATVWCAGLPKGASLTAQERHAIDQLSEAVSNVEVLRQLFFVRFASDADATFAPKETKQLWRVLARLPPAQVNQQIIRSFTHEDLGSKTSVIGLWDHEHVVLHEDRKKNEGDDATYEEKTPLTADEIKRYQQLTDAQLAQAVKDGWIKHENGMYYVTPIEYARFDSTVLHEVGHSVDDLLGAHTEIIYGAGGWKSYGVDQFEQWAHDMGALKNVKGDDKKDIVAVWKDAIRSGSRVSNLVDDAHPALSKTYEQDPLIAAARAGQSFQYKDDPRPTFNGRVFTTNGVVLSSLPKQTADCAPSEYALSAPAEYFAECYVEYYRGYKGTPETVDKKGGRLAAWIKDWFTKHVDTVRFSPQRLHGKVERPGGGDSSKSG